MITTIEKLCQWQQPKPGGRLWVCPVCEATANVTAGTTPGRRVCGPRALAPQRPAKQIQQASGGRQSLDSLNAAAISCTHRGDLIRNQECKPCQAHGQSPVPVFGCAIHGECTLNNTSIHPRIKACATCQDCTSLAPTKNQEPRTKNSPPRIAFLSPSMYPGGAERWMISLARWLPFQIVGAVITNTHLMHASMCREMGRYCPVVAHTPANAGRVKQIFQAADIIIAWGVGTLPEWIGDSPAKVVWVAHGSPQWTAGLVRAAAPRVHHWAGVSGIVRESFPSDLKSAMTVLHNGADIERCTPVAGRDATRAKWGIKPDQIAVGYIGRISPEKRPDQVAAAVACLPDNYVAVIVGQGVDGHQEAYLRSANRMASGRVIHTGHVDNVGDALAAVDVWFNASPAEGFSISLIEAWHAGKPCVSTPTGAIAELEAQHGSLVATIPHDATGPQMAAAIQSALRPSPIVARAKQLAWEQFTAPAMAHRWAEYLTGIINEPATTSPG